ncbi:unnamed protein product [Ascophyllum nodosum]
MSSFIDLLVFPANLEHEFSQQEKAKIKQTFVAFDVNEDGQIDMMELRGILSRMGEMPSEKQLQDVMREADTDGSDTLSFAELVTVTHKIKKDPNSTSATYVRKIHKAPAQHSGGMAYHSYSDDERMAFTEHINNSLAADPVVGPRLPMDPLSEALFTETSDGLILCKLINLAEFDTIDTRALNVVSEKRPKLSIFQKIENMNLALNAARSIGCVVTNVNAKDIIDGNSILILGLIWQIIRIQLLSSISLTSCPELVCLLEEDEELDGLLALQPEAILLRWFNYHLERSSCAKQVKNFSSDLRDGEALSVLLTQLDPNVCAPCNEPLGSEARAKDIIRQAKAMGVETFIQPHDITHANKKLLLAFCAQLFNTNPNLTVEQEVMEQFTEDFANLEDDDEGDTREEKVFRMWINSLAIDNGDLYINNLFADVQNGYAILKVMDRIQPGVVRWKRVNIKPKNRYKKVENGNYVIDIAKVMGLTVVNVGGLDIIDGNRKMTLAIMWQLMRRHTLNLLQASEEQRKANLSKKGKRIEDPQIVAWANSKVEGNKIRSFADPSLSTGVFLLQVCHGIDRSVVNWDLVTMEPGTDQDDKLNNAKYAISVARKLGACVFVASEDIVQVKSKMIMLFCASLWHCENERTVGPPSTENSTVGVQATRIPQTASPLSPSVLKPANSSPRPSPRQRFGSSASARAPPTVSPAKEAQRKADEETQRRIRAWKAQQQAREVQIITAVHSYMTVESSSNSTQATAIARTETQRFDSLASFAANAEASANAMGPSVEEEEARAKAAAAEAARVARQAEADGVRLAQEQMKTMSLQSGVSTDSTEVTAEEWDA